MNTKVHFWILNWSLNGILYCSPSRWYSPFDWGKSNGLRDGKMGVRSWWYLAIFPGRKWYPEVFGNGKWKLEQSRTVRRGETWKFVADCGGLVGLPSCSESGTHRPSVGKPSRFLSIPLMFLLMYTDLSLCRTCITHLHAIAYAPYLKLCDFMIDPDFVD